MAIAYSTQISGYKINHKRARSGWLAHVCASEGFAMGDLSIVLLSDEELLRYNKEYLNHNTLTDIITFDYSDSRVIGGDLLISAERILENALKFKCTFDDELDRVMVHGLLHLCGYTDKSVKDREIMRKKEDYYLSLRNF